MFIVQWENTHSNQLNAGKWLESGKYWMIPNAIEFILSNHYYTSHINRHNASNQRQQYIIINTSNYHQYIIQSHKGMGAFILENSDMKPLASLPCDKCDFGLSFKKPFTAILTSVMGNFTPKRKQRNPDPFPEQSRPYTR